MTFLFFKEEVFTFTLMIIHGTFVLPASKLSFFAFLFHLYGPNVDQQYKVLAICACLSLHFICPKLSFLFSTEG